MDADFVAYREKAQTAAKMKEIEFSASLTSREWDQAKRGFRPRDMDDKWYIGFYEPFLEFYRSWTRTLVFKLKVEHGEAGVGLGSLFAARDVEWYVPNPEWNEAEMVKSVMKWCLGLKGFDET